jgi:hypothetical protein
MWAPNFYLCMLKCSISFGTERDAYSKVLCPGVLLLDGGCIVMEGFPLARVAIPIETGGFNVHVKVVGHGLHHVVEGRAFILPRLFVVGNQVGVTVPKLPQTLNINTRIFHLVQQLVVDCQVVGVTKQVVHHDHITTQVGSIIAENLKGNETLHTNNIAFWLKM